MATDFTSQITGYYQAVQFRAPPLPDLIVYNTSLQSNTLTLPQVQTAIESDPYTVNIVNPVIREYQAAFGRVPDLPGLKYWTGVIAANPAALINLAQTFASSTEFQSRYGTTSADQLASPSVVFALYTNVLGRAPDAAGLQYWTNSGMTVTQLLNSFAQSVEFISNTNTAVVAFENLEIAGTAPTTGSLFQVPGSPTAGGKALFLINGLDNISGSGAGNDTIQALPVVNAFGVQVDTLQPGDSINDTGNNNTLKVMDISGGVIAGVTINGVQNLSVQNLKASTAEQIQGNITGVVAVTDTGSLGGVQIGAAGQGVNTLIQTLNISGSAAVHNDAMFVAASALAGTSDAVTINLAGGNIGAKVASGGASTITIAPDSGTNGYEQVTLNAASGNDIIALSQGSATAANTLNKLVITGAGNIEIGTDGSDNTALATIDASAATGNITITGANATTITGGESGLLTGATTALTSVRLGTGADVLDLSSTAYTAANIGSITLDGGAGRDTVIMSNAVATTNSALTLTSFEILGDTTANGTIDISKLVGIDTLKLYGNEAGTVTVDNATNGFTVDFSTFTGAGTTVSMPTSGAASLGTMDVLNVVLGSTTTGNAGAGAITAFGYETVNITALGGADTAANIAMASTVVTGNSLAATVSITGTKTLTLGSITDTSGLPNTSDALNIADTAAVTFNGTNFKTIAAGTSGGIIMTAADTALNNTITGSATKANQVLASTGDDTFTGGTATDTYVTYGGSDTINLGATHTIDQIWLGVGTLASGGIGAGHTNVAQAITTLNDEAQPGFWGVLANGTATSIEGATGLFGGAATGGTSVSQSVVTNFKVGANGDVINFSNVGFGFGGTNANGDVVHGLTRGSGTVPTVGTDAFVAQVTVAGGATTSIADLVEIGGVTFANAAALAAALHTTFSVSGFTLTASTSEHMLFAYSDGANTHIADVVIDNTNGTDVTSTTAAGVNIYASDTIQLTGIASPTSLTGNNVHFL